MTSEICACCNGVLDIDELVGLLPLAGDGGAAAQARSAAPPPPPRGSAGLAAPKGAGQVNKFKAELQRDMGRLKANLRGQHARSESLRMLGKMYLALPGGIFGWQNMQGAQAAHQDMDQLAGYVDERLAAVRATPTAAGSADVVANLAAYRDTTLHSRSMQRFIYWYAGVLSMAQSAVMLASVLLPTLEPVGALLLAVYASSFAVRYLGWEYGRCSAASALPGHTELPLLAQQGAALVRAQAARRQQLFAWASGFFCIYSAGALLSAAAVVSPPASLMLVGGAALLIGTLAVTYLNNWPIKDTFGKNQDANVGREGLGSQASVFNRIGYVQRQLTALEAFDSELSALPVGARERSRRLGDATIEGLLTVASYASFGLVWRPLQRWQHGKQIRELNSCGEAGQAPLKALQGSLRALAGEATAGRDAGPGGGTSMGLQAGFGIELPAVQDDILDFIGRQQHSGEAGDTPATGSDHAHGHAHTHGHAHAQAQAGCHQEHCHEHGEGSAAIVGATAVLHSLRFGLVTRKRYELGALLDHAQARARLGAPEAAGASSQPHLLRRGRRWAARKIDASQAPRGHGPAMAL